MHLIEKISEKKIITCRYRLSGVNELSNENQNKARRSNDHIYCGLTDVSRRKNLGFVRIAAE